MPPPLAPGGPEGEVGVGPGARGLVDVADVADVGPVGEERVEGVGRRVALRVVVPPDVAAPQGVAAGAEGVAARRGRSPLLTIPSMATVTFLLVFI